ncbi:hypothetical protein [Arthrobacter roseus]|uniref:hypothetical protein n=1 Tax=Arthrobacter roseus TaxID=136274 RepID=UPI0019666691|nr:hypothetical protein [Arthrobacter roseus]MBM7847688.1 hypothetical protein [Arthrobacter roseus]
MLNLQQDLDGFIHMGRHFPNKITIAITFTDGTRGEFSGARLNELYDEALAAYRLGNSLDAKGFDRAPAKIHRRNAVEIVPVSSDMAQ